ncbi:uncharacterized protein LOC119668719 [Teleopsis dalmanni]|uniref:uncharacterized protein LOC119668719 n=1 Tax=Teleopsis dalmanni TaxID=139649 RepID=UPI000D32BDEC|nr:uncharacterized protein LOC119668719 [Teleopsis dalmanni]
MYKFILFIFAVIITITTTTAKVVFIPSVNQYGNTVHPIQTVANKCDFHCTDVDLTVCATNGQCMQKFQGDCALTAYNCKNPHKAFVIIDNWKCEHSGAPRCSQGELNN